MAAIAIIGDYQKRRSLDDELKPASGIQGKVKECVKNFLILEGINTLDDVGVTELYFYRNYIDGIVGLNPRQRKYYKNGLEQALYACSIEEFKELKEAIDGLECGRAVKNKVATFLIASGRYDVEEIDYDLRCAYHEYLDFTIASSKIGEYIKAFDQLKLRSIKDKEKLGLMTPKYSNTKMFMLYYPVYEIANSFYYIQNKDELVFDFSINVSEKLKKQFFAMINHVLNNNENHHDRRERFLLPLKHLYRFCVDNGIEDIEQLTEEQVQQFKEELSIYAGSKTDIYIQIVGNFRKYLFVSVKETNWNANVWYLERFDFKSGRSNPAREVKSIRFDDIHNLKNRRYLKDYMRYQIGISQKESIQTVRCIYYGIHQFLMFLDQYEIVATNVNAEQMEEYVRIEGSKDNRDETFNKSIMSIERFYRYLVVNKEIARMPFYSRYYLRKTYEYHCDREVDLDTQFKILKVLKDFPLHLRLMYLNLWCVGLRLSEICILKPEMYRWDGKDAWLKCYQNKMRLEKEVPIPKSLYDLMKKYIDENHIKAGEYLFKNRKGGAYDAGTFSKQFKKELQRTGITEYNFRAHDFRHTVASFLYRNGASIEVIRDFLGHKETDMTKKYIDYIADIIDSQNERYFMETGSQLAAQIAKEIKENG